MAANTRDIRRRIKSIKNTAQITKAMQMVASAKMRRAQMAALAGRPYAGMINKVLLSVRDHADVTLHHPLLAEREVKRELVVVISPDKGLCGALNTNLLREATALDAERTDFIAVGLRGKGHLARTRRKLVADWRLPDAPELRHIKPISKFAIEEFLAGRADQVSVLHTQFVNTLVQKTVKRTLLPISPLELFSGSDDVKGEYTYEPGPMEVLDAVLPHYLHFQIYQMTLDALASEHSARMVAMKNATDNAQTLIKDLTLQYNKFRQAGITTELLEIATAQLALE